VVVVVAAVVLVASLASGSHRSPTASGSPGVAHSEFVRAKIGAAVEVASTAAVPRPSAAGETVAARAEQSFSFSLLQRLVGASPTADHVVSPYSLAEALLMLELGGQGPTATQIGDALHLSGMTASAQAADWAALAADLRHGAAADHVALQDADSLWVQPGFEVLPQYLASLKQSFDAGVWKVDFAQPQAVTSINRWASQETHGKIPRLLSTGDVDQYTRFALLNAVYFKAPWQTPLSDQGDMAFHAPSGDAQAPYVGNNGSGDLMASVADGVEEVQLPYWNGVPGSDQQSKDAGGAGRYVADIIMPTAQALPQWIEGLNGSSWRTLLGDLKSQPVDLTFPKFSLAGNEQLNQSLQALGIEDAFSATGADLSGISPTPTHVRLVQQAATLDVTKWGTVATAATAVIGNATAVQAPVVAVHIDHPFLFVIRDQTSGAILFTAAVNSPAG
jgi:serpin B